MNFLKHMILIRRREKGTLSQEEEAQLRAHEQTQRGRDDQRIWDAASHYRQSYQADPQAGLARFRQRLQEEERKKPSRLQKRAGPSRWLVAAAIALVLSVAWYVWQPSASEAPVWTQIIAEDGIREVVLADGTQVTLNTGAVLNYPIQFETMTHRQVKLSGEAYFAVEKVEGKSFIIETPQAEIEVLGTAFNLRAHPQESFTEVEVAQGRVALRKRQQKEEIILKAKECGSYTHNGELKKEAAPMLNRLAWHTNRLRFLETPLQKVIPMLERYFDIDIEGAEALDEYQCPISGDWTKGELQKIAEVIQALTPLRLHAVADGVYRLEGQGCQ